MANQHIFQLLKHAAESSSSEVGIYFYGNRRYGSTNSYLSYEHLLKSAYHRAPAVQKVIDLYDNKIVILHLENNQDAIIWFWSIIAAGGIPCLSTLFSADLTARQNQLCALERKLGNAGIITSRQLAAQFEDERVIGLLVEDYEDQLYVKQQAFPFEDRYSFQRSLPNDNLAVLMLTSGSTGNSKAVRLTHSQIFASLEGKSAKHQTTYKDIFLSWIALNHVANLLEIHLHALKLNAPQVQIEASDVLHDPMIFLNKLKIHRITYTFAPNFFLSRLIKVLEPFSLRNQSELVPRITSNGFYLDLSALRVFISGGEANDIDTCVKLTELFRMHGAPFNFLRPGFGMTETCAGCIYNLKCPRSDVSLGRDIASLGTCIPKLEMRINKNNGELQLKGPVLFDGYHNDPEATEESWTEDGWFRTGDQGYIDSRSGLNLTGRTKDMIIVNGINYNLQAIESAIGEAEIQGIVPSYVVAFADRPTGSDTEKLVVLYAPEYETYDGKSRVNTAILISKAIMKHCNVHAYCILPLVQSLLPKSSLGKFSRAKLRDNLRNGVYKQQIEQDKEITRAYQNSVHEEAITEIECVISDAYHNIFESVTPGDGTISRNDNLFSLGLSSIDLLKFKLNLQTSLKLENISISLFFAHPVVSDFAAALDRLLQKKDRTYDPVVVLQPHGSMTPLWLIHPGVGDILIFMPLARYITDRPVYALRARGFDGEPLFNSLSEFVSTYYAAIKRKQPHGPYAIAGYSFGSILAFEITKIMQQSGDEVRFLATIDQLPYFKMRARSYDWYECVLSIAFFVGLIEEDYAYSILPRMRFLTHDQVLDHILSLAPPARIQELALSRWSLNNWAEIALGIKKTVWDYDPSGKVMNMDVFYAEPKKGIMKDETTEDWLRDYMGKWSPFVEEGKVRYHEVMGTHRTIISVPHLKNFQAVFQRVMSERGV